MPRKSLAPAFIVIKYTTTVNSVVLNHEMVVPVNVLVWNGDTTNLIRKGGTNAVWSTEMVTFVQTFDDMYHTSSVFTTFELWRQDSAAADPQLIATYAPVGLVGTSAGTTVQASGVCYAFRSLEDSAYRLMLMESNQAADQRKAYASLSATQKAPIDYLLGANSPVYARSNSYLSTFGIYTTKTYDVLRKKRLGM